jgi:hypothetical protein
MDTTTNGALMSESSIPQVTTIATELRAIADSLDTLAEMPLNRLWVRVDIQPSGTDDDEQKIATIDAIGQAVVGKAGTVRVMSDGVSYHHDASGTLGTVVFSVFSSVASPAERERLAEVTRLRAELDELKARPPAVSDDPNPEANCCDHFVSSHYPTGCYANSGGCDCKLDELEARAAVSS